MLQKLDDLSRLSKIRLLPIKEITDEILGYFLDNLEGSHFD